MVGASTHEEVSTTQYVLFGAIWLILVGLFSSYTLTLNICLILSYLGLASFRTMMGSFLVLCRLELHIGLDSLVRQLE